MKNLIFCGILLMLFTLSSCELVGDIFNAGFYTGLFVVILVIATIIFIVAKIRRR
ncbi:MAG: hypothetical protein WEB30_04295 [Cyclobacteriaceae bacterium]